jgi:hypothetical protein
MGKKLAAILSRSLRVTVDISLLTHLHSANSPFMGVIRCMEALQERVLRDARPDTLYENDDVLEAATISFTDYLLSQVVLVSEKEVSRIPHEHRSHAKPIGRSRYIIRPGRTLRL